MKLKWPLMLTLEMLWSGSLYTFTGIIPPASTHIQYIITHDTLSAMAFVAQLAERRTRYAGSWVRFSPWRPWSCIFHNWSPSSHTHSQNILIVYLYKLSSVKYHTLTGITTIHVYIRNPDTFSATAFVAHYSCQSVALDSQGRRGSSILTEGLIGVAFFATGFDRVFTH